MSINTVQIIKYIHVHFRGGINKLLLDGYIE
jgi:hypothetical protein